MSSLVWNFGLIIWKLCKLAFQRNSILSSLRNVSDRTRKMPYWWRRRRRWLVSEHQLFQRDGLLFFDGLGRGLAGQSLYRICEGREGTGRWARGGRWAARPRFCSSRFSPALCLHFASNTTVPVEMDCHHSDRFAALVSHVLRSIPVTLRKPV